jgi:hypothetical protein
MNDSITTVNVSPWRNRNYKIVEENFSQNRNIQIGGVISYSTLTNSKESKD